MILKFKDPHTSQISNLQLIGLLLDWVIMIYWYIMIFMSVEYLGSGYDIVKANTLGDINEAEDIGYRAQVIDFSWAKTDVGVTNSLEWLQPIGGWVRPKVSCGETETVCRNPYLFSI